MSASSSSASGQPWLGKKGNQLMQLVAAAVEQTRSDRADSVPADASDQFGSLTDHALETKKRALEEARLAMAHRPKEARIIELGDDPRRTWGARPPPMSREPVERTLAPPPSGDFERV